MAKALECSLYDLLDHELGHDQLHRSLAKGESLVELMLYDMSSRSEYEANIVSAEILLPDEDILELFYDYKYDVEQIVRSIRLDINLVVMKTEILRSKSYNLEKWNTSQTF